MKLNTWTVDVSTTLDGKLDVIISTENSTGENITASTPEAVGHWLAELIEHELDKCPRE